MSEKFPNSLEVIFDGAQPMHVRDFDSPSLSDNLFAGLDADFGHPPINANRAYATDYFGFADWATEYIYTAANSRSEVAVLRRQLIVERQFLSADNVSGGDFSLAMAFADVHHDLITPRYDPKMSGDNGTVYTPEIEMYVRDEARVDGKGDYLPDHHQVWRMPELLTLSLDAQHKFTGKYAEQLPLLSRFVLSTNSCASKLAEKFDVQSYVREQAEPQECKSELRILDNHAVSVGKLTELQVKVDDLELKPARVKKDRDSLSFKDLRHVKFYSKTQEANDIEISKKPVVLTGRNGSGKTHLLEAIGLATTSVASIGFASAEQAEIPEMAGMGVLFRPRGGHDGLSAFGSEAKQWGEVLDWLEELGLDKCKLILSDEPFSSTDHHEQSIILEKLINRLQQLGTHVVMTSHSDVSDLAEKGVVLPYHFERSGSRKHMLAEGIGDSDAFNEAREQGLTEEIIARAAALVNGADFVITDVIERDLVQRPSVFDRYGDVNPGLGWLMPRMTAAPSMSEEEEHEWLMRYRRDQEADLPRFYISEAAAPDITNIALTKDEMLGWSMNEALKEMLFEGSTSCESDLLKRQEFFGRLMEYEKLDDLQAEASEFMLLFHGLSEDSWQNHHTGEHHLDAFVAKPLADPAMTLVGILRSSCGRDWYDSTSAPPYKLRAEYIEAAASAVQEIIGPHVTEELQRGIGKFIEAARLIFGFRGQLSDDRSSLVVGETDREKLYDCVRSIVELADAHGDKEDDDDQDGKSWLYNNCIGKLDETFYDWEYDDVLRRNKTGLKKEISLHYVRGLEDMLHTDYGSLLGELVGVLHKKMPVLSLDVLDDAAHSTILRIKESCERAEATGMKTPAVNALSVLAFASSPDDPLEKISTHLKSVGGTVADSLADYFDQDLRKYFDGQRGGLAYKDRIKVKTEGIALGKQKDKKKERSAYGLRRDRLYKVMKTADCAAGRTEIVNHGYGNAKPPITPHSEAFLLWSLAKTAKQFKKLNFSPVKYVDEGIQLDLMVDPRAHNEMVASDLLYRNRGGIDIISGSNMSGKTTFGKSLFMNIAYAQSTGYARGQNIQMPVYQNVIYVDRPKHDPGKGLSSFGADIDNWKQVIEKLENAAPSFVFIDEPFSTTSSKYQEGLILSTLEWLASRGHRVVMATHNHEVIDRVRAAQDTSAVDITFHNLRSELDEDGDVQFTYKFTEGEAPSMALAVARKIGGPALAAVFA